MTMTAADTYGFNVEASFHNLFSTHCEAIQADVNAALGTAHDLQYLQQHAAEVFPSVRGWFFLGAVPDRRRDKLVSTAQIDLFVYSPDYTLPDRRLLLLIRDGLMRRLDLQTTRTGFYALFAVKDYFTSLSSPATLATARLETRGWREIPEPDPHVSRLSADFQVFHR
jgi:hypothetical protein